jgi:hypothetical protein
MSKKPQLLPQTPGTVDLAAETATPQQPFDLDQRYQVVDRLDGRVSALSSFDPRPGCSLAECPTNLDLDTDEGKAMAFSAMSPGDLDIGNEGYVEFVATKFLIFPDTRLDEETGEVIEFSRTVFFGTDGQTYRTSGEMMPHRVKALCQLFSPERWKQGIKLRVSERRSRKTLRTYHDIRIAL